jgi:hypothetical protein
VDRVSRKKQTVECEVLTDLRQHVEGRNGQRVTELTEVRFRGNDKQW